MTSVSVPSLSPVLCVQRLIYDHSYAACRRIQRERLGAM